ncbi:MAG: type III-A CRISPR-associated RAMP protein Csm5 [Trichococcus flocculiformis]|jgi:CRISPR-associated protein Csm5|uniref:CRISPR system Cms protein Csm5 n=1 Tax=Trichococcus flocculiformis TaxID=82803 RepID=A0A847D471_9LACT|nr:type III-A CRISPR-associated RAMP protein Csm5 [Trichococcus flocculiformis]MDI9502752.1 type III-A CRISPR-associated RAMP protein Csm5 [Bacillota bacterium]NLD31174.1 type III-A CRISPR-associated RAMP protein Csm5 [Trichococcus flocculiformis]NLK58686.1 type III-A CRISPR-associated RAMP protein Csm5 [Tissierellia bacterium]
MIKHFDVVLRCEGPVHIGAGTQIPKRELWYDEKKQRLSVLDIPRMMRDLTSRQRESLYSFLLGKTNRFEMRQMLSDMGLQEEKIRQWEKYGFPFQKNAYRNMRDIMCCVKDGFGFPYVPGSSLKGALRTIFLSYQIQNDKQAKEKTLNHMANEFYRSAYKQNKVAKQMAQESARLEDKYFSSKQTSHDRMRGLSVSDSERLSLDQIVIADKADLSSTEFQPKKQKIPLWRESIKKGAELHFRISIDTDRLGLSRHFSLNDLQERIDLYHENYELAFLQYFEEEYAPYGSHFYLGGGSGFYTKTVLYEYLMDENEDEIYRKSAEIAEKLMHEKFKRGKHLGSAKKWGFSPKLLKLTTIENDYVEMGRVSLDLSRSHEINI